MDPGILIVLFSLIEGEKRDKFFCCEQDVYLTKLGAMISYYYNRNPGAPKPSKEEKFKFFNTLNNYLTWRAIMPYLSFLSKPFQVKQCKTITIVEYAKLIRIQFLSQKAEKTFVKSLGGAQGREERWRSCASATNAAMGFAVATAFVREAQFTEEAKRSVQEIVGMIKSAFKGLKRDRDHFKS